jgi:two-component system sensor histidine kinase/response regulator
MATLLIVDDEPLNRELLHAYLDGLDHQVVDAASGEEALAVAAKARPDLVLLDVMMPGLDGFETTRRLKSAFKDELLPVVLVTALADHDSRLRGLRAGADEFLTKPVDRHELLLRVSNLLSLRSHQVTLQRRNVELVELQRFRDEMSAMVVHDLKNPLAVILANLEFVLDGGNASDDREALLDSRAAGHRMVRLLANLADLTRIELGKMRLSRSRFRIGEIVEPLMRQRAHLAQARDITLGTSIETDEQIFADPELISRVVENVFDNALRHTPPGGRIAVRGETASETGAVQLKIGNTGTPIPPQARDRIFEKFAQAEGDVGRMNLGLGLYFCRLAAEAHGGRIWVEETKELPTVFGLELPAYARG